MDDVLPLARSLPRSSEAYVRGQLKFRIGRIVWLAFSRDETIMEFAFPKEWRPYIVESEPHKFMLPRASDMRWNWVHVRLAALDEPEMRDLVVEAWRFCVPKSVAAAYDALVASGRA